MPANARHSFHRMPIALRSGDGLRVRHRLRARAHPRSSLLVAGVGRVSRSESSLPGQSPDILRRESISVVSQKLARHRGVNHVLFQRRRRRRRYSPWLVRSSSSPSQFQSNRVTVCVNRIVPGICTERHAIASCIVALKKKKKKVLVSRIHLIFNVSSWRGPRFKCVAWYRDRS